MQATRYTHEAAQKVGDNTSTKLVAGDGVSLDIRGPMAVFRIIQIVSCNGTVGTVSSARFEFRVKDLS